MADLIWETMGKISWYKKNEKDFVDHHIYPNLFNHWNYRCTKCSNRKLPISYGGGSEFKIQNEHVVRITGNDNNAFVFVCVFVAAKNQETSIASLVNQGGRAISNPLARMPNGSSGSKGGAVSPAGNVDAYFDCKFPSKVYVNLVCVHFFKNNVIPIMLIFSPQCFIYFLKYYHLFFKPQSWSKLSFLASKKKEERKTGNLSYVFLLVWWLLSTPRQLILISNHDENKIN